MLEPQSGEIVVPPTSQLSRVFWEGCEQRRLMFQRCDDCQKPNFNPTHICRFCRSHRLAWETSSGRGAVYSYTVCWRSPIPAFVTPYAPAIVTLEEGWDMISAIVKTTVEELRVGLPVQVLFHRAGGRTLPYFEPTL